MKDRKIRGLYVVLGGIIFAILPLSVALTASIFVKDAMNEGSSAFGVLPWFTFLTAPIGAVAVLIGLIIGFVNLVKRKS
jgi:TRAP-type C4-dicarboxylate transport system permease small subunit